MQLFKGKKILVYGYASSGECAVKLLHEQGANISIYDDNLKGKEQFCFENQPLEKEYDYVILSPGVKVIGNKLIEKLSKKSNILSEIDLGYLFLKGKIIGVTGTNGKTTVVSLLGEIFKRAKKDVFVCGNIGVPISAIADKTNSKSFTICEVSNFQLESSKIFNPDIAVILNFQEDHLDRHGNFLEYVRVKNLITQNFKSDNYLIANLDDKFFNLVDKTKNMICFSKQKQKKGCYINNNFIYFNRTKIISVNDIKLIGEKNLENIMACISVAKLCGIRNEIIKNAISEFWGLEHRLEFVKEINGVKYFNDSKATNVACVKMAIESVKSNNLVLMLGGLNKACDFEQLFNQQYNIKKIVCFGKDGKEIMKYASKYGYQVDYFESMRTATLNVIKNSIAGDLVLFSPGCASFDEFSSYEERGKIFKEIINEFDKIN